MYIPCHRRFIVIDQTGEWRRNYPDWPRATGLEMTLRTLQGFADQRAHEWRLITYMHPREVEAFAGFLIPLGDVYESSPVLKMGGFAMLVDEVDVLLSPSYVPEEMRSLYRRGRHARLTMISATQRPGSTSKEIVANATAVHIFALHNPGDLKYVEELAGNEESAKITAWVAAKPFRYATWTRATRKVSYHEPL